MSSVAANYGATTALADLEGITDEERLRTMWQQAEDFGDRRRIRARMYKLREQRLREMMQNDDDSLGKLTIKEDGGLGMSECSETTINVDSSSTRRPSNIQVTMHVDGDSAVTESISTQNVRLGGLTMRGVEAEDVIQERIRKASQDRTGRYQRILADPEGTDDADAVLSITKSTYSIQSNALAGEGYLSMKNKEVRDSVSPTRVIRERRSSAEDADGRLTSDDEATLKAESENVIEALKTSAPKTSTSRRSSRDEVTITTSRRTSKDETTTSTSRRTSKDETNTSRTSRSRQSEIPVRKDSSPRKVSERKMSRELDLSQARRAPADKTSPTSPTKRSPGDSPTKTQPSRRTGAQKDSPTSPAKSPTRKTSSPLKKSHLAEMEAAMEQSIKGELEKLDSYLKTGAEDEDEVILEEEEDMVDEAGNVVRMVVQTTRKKDGTECTARRVARSTRVVDSESEIDEILIGNPDHEVVERDVAEEEDKDGNKIKIITETRRRPDGITYTTKNVLKTSKIFDYDHPENVAYNEDDELVSTDQSEETDENGITIRTVTETRRKPGGMEYTTKKVYKTSKVKSTRITPSDDDEVIDTQESEETTPDGSIIRTVVETRRTKTGEEYTHRQVFRSRRMTLSGVDLQHGLFIMANDDEVINKEEKEETDDSGHTVKVVTEIRRRKDGSTYSFEYVRRSFQGTEDDVKKIHVGSSSNIAVSAEDKLLKEDVKEEVQEDGSTVKTIIERRRAKDGTEYLRHRIMRIPKMPDPVLQVGNLEDEVLQEKKDEKTLDDGTQVKAVTERRRSSVSGVQYTLRRVSKVYQQHSLHPTAASDEILDENVTEEETDEGTTVKTVIQRYQRPDGSVYTTHNIHKTFSSPAPVTILGIEDDELIDRQVDEQETEDGYIIKTITETRKRADGVQYTVERAERSARHSSQLHITLGADCSKKPEDVVQVGSPEDTIISSEEKEMTEEDGTVVKTVVEVRQRKDGSQYTAKTVVRSTALLVPERETSYVVIKPEGDEDEDGLFPSMDDEIVYTRKKQEIDEEGQPITVIIETRQSKTTGEKYNITKRVYTKDVLMTEQGEKEIPKSIMKSTLVANINSQPTAPLAPATNFSSPRQSPRVNPALKATPTPKATPAFKVSHTPTLTPKVARSSPGTSPTRSQPNAPSQQSDEEPDTVPYGSVSALKNRFAPVQDKKSEPSEKVTRPDRQNTLNKKKFFEDAARHVTSKSPTPKLPSRKPDNQEDKPSIEVKLRDGSDEVTTEDVETHNVTYQTPDTRDIDQEIAKLEEEEEERYEKEPEDEIEPEDEEEEPEEEVTSPSEEEPQEPVSKKPEPTKKSPTASKTPSSRTPRRTVEAEPRKRREISPRKTEEPSRRTPRKPLARDEPTPRRTTTQREPATRDTARRTPKPINTSPKRAPTHGHSPDRSREVTPNGRCCKRHGGEAERVSPTRTQKTTPRSTSSSPKKTSPERRPRMNGDIHRVPTEPRINGDVSRTTRTRKLVEKSNEPERTRPNKVSHTPRKSPTTRSPDKREPSRPSDRRTPAKPISDKTPKTRPSETGTKSSLAPPEPIVTLPETPMTEDMKPLPVEEEDGPMIEDVSSEPNLPYHTIHRPSIVREPSEYNIPESQEEPTTDSSPDDQPSDTEPKKKSPKKTAQEPVKEDVSRPRKTKPLESRLSDKNLRDNERGRKKQPDTRRANRDRPWLMEKRNSFEKKKSEPKMSTPKQGETKKTPEKKVYERKASEELLELKKEEPVEEDTMTPEEEPEVSRDVSPARQEESEEEPETHRKTEEIPSKVIRDVEQSVASQIIPDKEVSTTEVAARRSLFNTRVSQPTTRNDKPYRKPSYEMKESVFSRRSLFEQGNQNTAPTPTPVRRPVLKTKRDEQSWMGKPEEKQPVKEPIIVPKHIYPLGDRDEDQPKDQSAPKPVEEEVNITSSKLVMNAMAATDISYRKPEDDTGVPHHHQRSPSPKPKDVSPSPYSKEDSPSRPRQDASPKRPSKDMTHRQPSKDVSPKRHTHETSPRRPSQDASPRQPSRDASPRRPSQDASPRRPSKDMSPRQPSQDMSPRRPSQDLSPRQPTQDASPRRPSRDASPRQPSQDTSPRRPSKDISQRRPSKDVSPVRSSKEKSPSRPSKESSPAPFSKESSPTPFSKESSPSRFVTGKPIDSGLNTTKLRRIERTSSNKKLLEDLEVPTENLPSYIGSIDTITDVATLEIMLEKAVTYEERRLIRGQLRIAKRVVGSSPTPAKTTPAPSKTPAPDKTPAPAKASTSDIPADKTERKRSTAELIMKQPKEEEAPRRVSKADEPWQPSSAPEQPTTQVRDEPSTDSYTKEPKRGLSKKFHDDDESTPLRKVSSEIKPRREVDELISKPVETTEETPRRFGRMPEEPKRAEPLTKTPEPSRAGRTPTQPTKTATPANEPYVEPLRYQKGQNRTPSQPAPEQSDVDKIVSAYGVGPTDENGIPLFGLRALKRRTPTATPPEDQPATTEETKKDVYEPKDSSGRPMFGLRSLKTSSPSTTDTSHHTTSVVESSRLVSSVTSKRSTHTTEVASSHSEEEEEEEEGEETEEEGEGSRSEAETESLADEEERSPGLVRDTQDSLRRQSKSPEPRSSEGEVIRKRSQPLQDILKLHESKVQESPQLDDSPRQKPKQRLRDNFDPDPETRETRVTKTWDMESDLSTRSQDVRNIIAHHETTTDTKPEKKLTGILKKTSSSNLLGTTTITTLETVDRENTETKHQLASTDEILDTLTEDQIARLSQEFDLRAQEDGVIKAEETETQELPGGYRISTRTEGEGPDGAKFTRKTSYTEIKLQQPTGDGGVREVSSSSSATVETSGATTTFTVTSDRTGDQQQQQPEMREGRSFLEDRSKVTGITDVLSRMGATEAVDHEAKVTSDDQARSLLNRFLGAQVLMSGVESMMAASSLSDSPRAGDEGEAGGKSGGEARQHSTTTTTSTTASKVEGEPVVVRGVNITEVSDEGRLNQLLDSCDEYEDRRRVRMRLKNLMAQKKALREELSGHDLGARGSGGSQVGAAAHQTTRETLTATTTGTVRDLRSSEDVAVVNAWLKDNFPSHPRPPTTTSTTTITAHDPTYSGDNKSSSTVAPFGASHSTTEVRSSTQGNVHKSSYSTSYSTSSSSSSTTAGNRTYVTKTESKKVSPFEKFKQLDAQAPRPASRE